MHELAIATSIVDLVEEAANARTVIGVNLDVGALSGVSTDALLFCFDEVAKGTVLEGAVLAIRRIEGRARCEACGAEFAPPDFLTPCGCGSTDLVRLAGEELNVKAIRLAEAT